LSASSVDRSAHPSLKERRTMLTKGSSMAHNLTEARPRGNGVITAHNGGADPLAVRGAFGS
jgi:hypothetical protein